MIFAAGLGTRLKPWTDNNPKSLAVINGKSLLQRNIEYLQHWGLNNVVVNVHHFSSMLITEIEKNKGWGSTVTISDETEEVLETGGGLLKAAPLLEGFEKIVLINADVLTDLNLDEMLTYHLKSKSLVTLATTNRITSRYFLFDTNNNLVGWTNDKTGEIKSNFPLQGNEIKKAFSGIHIIEKDLLKLIPFRGKFSIVEVYLHLMKDYNIRSFDHSGSRFIDVGKPESVETASKLFQ